MPVEARTRLRRRVVVALVSVVSTAVVAAALSVDRRVQRPIVVERYDWRTRTVVKIACVPDTADVETDESLPPVCSEAS